MPGSDGRLHRCDLSRCREDEGLAALAHDDFGATASPRPVPWRVPPPGLGDVYLSEPVWSSEPRLRKWVFVALSRLLHGRGRSERFYEAPKIWWLEMNEQAGAILAAGPLTQSAVADPTDQDIVERSPSVAGDAGGTIRLVYLARRPGESSCRLRSAEIGIDPAPGRPRLESASGTSRTLGEGLAPAPLLVSADGSRVFALAGSGPVARFDLAGPVE